MDWSGTGKASLAVGEYLVVDEAERKGRTKVECKEEPLYQLFNPIQKGKTAKVTADDQRSCEKDQLFNPIQKGKTAKVPSASEHQRQFWKQKFWKQKFWRQKFWAEIWKAEIWKAEIWKAASGGKRAGSWRCGPDRTGPRGLP